MKSFWMSLQGQSQKFLQELGPNPSHATKRMAVIHKIMPRVARHSTDEQWMHFMETGELPPVPLTHEELEVLRGGENLKQYIIDVYNSQKNEF